MLYWLPRNAPAITPEKIAVAQPCMGVPPDAMASEIERGMLTRDTESPARQLRLASQNGCCQMGAPSPEYSGSGASLAGRGSVTVVFAALIVEFTIVKLITRLLACELMRDEGRREGVAILIAMEDVLFSQQMPAREPCVNVIILSSSDDDYAAWPAQQRESNHIYE